jgi:uncharacterized repeat protein (TIGR01451 family)
MQELVTLFSSDIVRLLGALGLVSLGITLTLWGLKRRRSGAVLIALLLCLAALVPTVLADHLEIPPAGSVAQIQTSGPATPLNIGDWYTNSSTTGPGYHSFDIFVPCTIVSPTGVLTVQLFDPEVYYDGTADDLDEIRDATDTKTNDNGDANDATFTLFHPSGAQIVSQTYTPTVTTSGVTVTLASFSVASPDDCGVYTLRAATSGNDDNAWKLRVDPDDFDGTPGTGDEINLGNVQTSFQNVSLGCQTFHFLVPEVPSIRLSNFDMDVPGYCTSPTCTVTYITPSDTVISGTESAGTEWNNVAGSGYPPPGGDEILDPEPGWWQAVLCLNDDNQYIFDTGGLTYFYYRPPTPDMSVGKDDGTGTFNPDGVLNYTITYNNGGPGAALDAMLTDTLPLSTTFVSCSGGLSCGYVPPPPGSGVVTFSLGTIAAGASGSVWVSVHVDAGAPTGTLTNTVELGYSDVLFSDYPVETATDVDRYREPSEPEPSGPEPSDPDEGPEPASPPAPTPIPPTPVPPTPTVEVVTVARLPETGGFPGWFTVVLGVPLIIGVAGLLNLAVLGIRARRGDGKWD